MTADSGGSLRETRLGSGSGVAMRERKVSVQTSVLTYLLVLVPLSTSLVDFTKEYSAMVLVKIL